MHDRRFVIDRNIQSIQELLPVARDCGIGLMIENLPEDFNTARPLAQLLDPLPELGLHLDIGHSSLLVEQNTADKIMAAYGSRLRHVHLHDNKGGSGDLHLAPSAGTVDVARHVKALCARGYDGTITLEVFTADKHYRAYSRDVRRRIWNECAAGITPAGPMAEQKSA